jgi:hypothetical protein
MNKTLIGVFVIASGAVLAIRSWPEKKTPPPADQSTAAAPADTSEINTELRQLRGEVAQLRLSQQAAAADPAAAQPARSAPERERPSPEKIQEKRRAFVERVAQGYARQSRDAAWASSTEAAIGDVLRTNVTDSRVLSASCATTLCRVVVESDNEEAQHALSGEIASAEPFAPGVIYDRSGLTTTMYVRRATDVAF